jgi:hypothetical protein
MLRSRTRARPCPSGTRGSRHRARRSSTRLPLRRTKLPTTRVAIDLSAIGIPSVIGLGALSCRPQRKWRSQVKPSESGFQPRTLAHRAQGLNLFHGQWSPVPIPQHNGCRASMSFVPGPNAIGSTFSPECAHNGTWSMLDAAVYGAAGSYRQFSAASGSRCRLTGCGFAPGPLRGSPAFGIVQVSFSTRPARASGQWKRSGSRFLPRHPRAWTHVRQPIRGRCLTWEPPQRRQALPSFRRSGCTLISVRTIQRVFVDHLNLQVLGVTQGPTWPRPRSTPGRCGAPG